MPQHLYIQTTGCTDPYSNLALEEYLTLHAAPGECILYLWQNKHTVVIGQNQNAWKECRTGSLEKDGGRLARRLSGGGAVYHDLGNLNFTFIAQKKHYHIDRQLEVILRAVQQLGIAAKKIGRNDLTIEGCKFSGNAFYQTGPCCYHHGTILVNMDKSLASRYLTVSKEKLASKGVASVQSRMTNLIEHNTAITIEQMKTSLLSSFSEVYGLPVLPFDPRRLDHHEIARLTEKYSHWNWRYGKRIPFQDSIEKRFPWGEIEIQLQINSGILQETQIHSDAMDYVFISILSSVLRGCRFYSEDILEALSILPEDTPLRQQMKEDIQALIQNML